MEVVAYRVRGFVVTLTEEENSDISDDSNAYVHPRIPVTIQKQIGDRGKETWEVQPSLGQSWESAGSTRLMSRKNPGSTRFKSRKNPGSTRFRSNGDRGQGTCTYTCSSNWGYGGYRQ